jgi:hypothetical protein
MAVKPPYLRAADTNYALPALLAPNAGRSVPAIRSAHRPSARCDGAAWLVRVRSRCLAQRRASAGAPDAPS